MGDEIKELTLSLASLSGGGIQRITLGQINEALKRGVKVNLLVVNATGKLRDKIPEGCKLIDLQAEKTRYALVKLVRYLKLEKPRYLISSQTHLNVLMIIARRFAGYPKKLIVTEHITFNHDMLKNGGFLERLRPLLIRVFYPAANRVVAVSQSAAGSIRRFARYQGDIEVIENGLDLEVIRSRGEEPPTHPWYSTLDLKLVIGIGRLSRQKNFSLLLKAFARTDNRENVRLLILGEGPEREKLTWLSNDLGIQEHVDFLGFVEDPFPYLTHADLFVLSSKWEGFATVVIEALACGVPIVSTNCPGGPREILDGRNFAKIVPLGDETTMANAIEEMISIKHDKNNILKYAEKFAMKHVVQRYLELFSEID